MLSDRNHCRPTAGVWCGNGVGSAATPPVRRHESDRSQESGAATSRPDACDSPAIGPVVLVDALAAADSVELSTPCFLRDSRTVDQAARSFIRRSSCASTAPDVFRGQKGTPCFYTDASNCRYGGHIQKEDLCLVYGCCKFGWRRWR